MGYFNPRQKMPENIKNTSSNLSNGISERLEKVEYPEVLDLSIPKKLSECPQDAFNDFSPRFKYRYEKIKPKSRRETIWLINNQESGQIIENCLIDASKMEAEYISWHYSQKSVLSKCNGEIIRYGLSRGKKCSDVPDHDHARPGGICKNQESARLQNTLYIKHNNEYYRYSNGQFVFHHSQMAPLYELHKKLKKSIFLANFQLYQLNFTHPENGSVIYIICPKIILL